MDTQHDAAQPAPARPPRWVKAFLETLALHANVSEACKAANIDRAQPYRLRGCDPGFAALWDRAMQVASDSLEREAWRRAVEGLPRKKFTKSGDPIIDPATGEQYVEHEYSDTLLLRYLGKVRPGEWRERQQLEHTGPGGGPVEVKSIVYGPLPAEGLDPPPA